MQRIRSAIGRGRVRPAVQDDQAATFSDVPSAAPSLTSGAVPAHADECSTAQAEQEARATAEPDAAATAAAAKAKAEEDATVAFGSLLSAEADEREHDEPKLTVRRKKNEG
jgi:hypothetical protein